MAWSDVRDDQVADTIARFTDLPGPYRDWVQQQAWSKGLPALRMGSRMGAGEWTAWEALVTQCELEVKRRAEAKEKESA